MAKKLKPGDSIRGYTVHEKINEGGQGIGYRAKDSGEKDVFFKQYKTPTARSAEGPNFAKRQKILQKQFDSIRDFVPKVFEFFEEGGIYYEVSEILRGTALSEGLYGRPPLSDDLRLKIAKVTAFGLKQLHEQGTAHLDLKPDNLFVEKKKITDASGKPATVVTVRLIDFSSAIADGVRPDVYCGTPGYSSPEHIDSRKFGLPDVSSDVFTLGIIFYELLAKAYPYSTGDGAPSLEEQTCNRITEEPIKLNRSLPQEVSELLWQMIAPQPSDRPTMEQVHQTLLKANRGGATRVVAPTRVRGGKSVGGGRPAPAPGAPTTRVAFVGHGRRIRVHKNMVVGQTQFRGVPGCRFLEKRQARVFWDGGKGAWVISVLKACTNPLTVSGSEVTGHDRRVLQEGDTVKVGDFEMKIEFEPIA